MKNTTTVMKERKEVKLDIRFNIQIDFLITVDSAYTQTTFKYNLT